MGLILGLHLAIEGPEEKVGQKQCTGALITKCALINSAELLVIKLKSGLISNLSDNFYEI